jgi:hypothetical protein
MHLMYYIGADGKRVYTLQKAAPDGTPTHSAHPGALRRAAPCRRAAARPSPRPRRRRLPKRLPTSPLSNFPGLSPQRVFRPTTSFRGSA